MDKKELKKIIALVFIEGKKEFPLADNKTRLATKIVKHSAFKHGLTPKTLLNYYNYFFGEFDSNINPSSDTIEALLSYINYQSQKQFLKNQPTNEDYLDKVPFSKQKEEERVIENNIELSHSTHLLPKNKKNRLLILGIVMITIVSISGFISYKHWIQTKNEKSVYWDKDKFLIVPYNLTKEGINIQTINIKEVNINTFRKIVPTKETEFFDKNTNQPKIWYATNNNHTDFFNEKGVHPITGLPLQLVTQKVIDTYLHIVKDNYKEPNSSETNITTYEPKSKSIFNQSVKNTVKNKELSLFIFDSLNNLDYVFSNRLEEQLKEHYSVTSLLILPSQMSKEVIEHLKIGDILHFEDEIYKHTDYICVGNTDYTLRQNKIYSSRTTCELSIHYSIISVKTGEVINTYTNTIKGNGLTSESSKANTIKKFTL